MSGSGEGAGAGQAGRRTHRVQLDRRARAQVDDLEDLNLGKLVELLQVARQLLVGRRRLARRRELALREVRDALRLREEGDGVSAAGAEQRAGSKAQTHRVDDRLEPKQLLAVDVLALELALDERPAQGRVLADLALAVKLLGVGALDERELGLERAQVEQDLVRRDEGRPGVEDLWARAQVLAGREGGSREAGLRTCVHSRRGAGPTAAGV